jgi:uncharacterized protein YcnI
MRRLLWARVGVVFAASAVGVVGFGAVAWAHVTVTPGTAPRGGDAVVSFQVPNEEDTANTVKIEVNLPADKPIASVSTEPVAGWTAVTETTKLAQPIKSDDGDVTEVITKITWTADVGGGIKPGSFQRFAVAFDSLPDTDGITLKTLQTYSNGDVVRWIDEADPGQPEPAHPAPVLTLVKTDDGTAQATGGSSSTPAASTSTKSGGDGAALGFGIAGLVLGAAGLVFGFLAFRRTAARSS